MIAGLGISDGVGAAGTSQILAAMLPECFERANGGPVVAGLKEMAEALALRSPIDRVFRIIDVDLEFGGKEVREASIGKIQYEARASHEVDEVVN